VTTGSAGSRSRWARWARSARSALGHVARRAGVQRRSTAERAIAKLTAKRAEQAAALTTLAAHRDRLKDLVEAQAAELDRLRDAGDLSAARTRDDLSFVFIVTYGRSGSTLLQGILSSTPGIAIRGENGAVLHDLFHFHDTVVRHRERLSRPNPLPASHPWWGIDGYRDETALRDIRVLVLETLLRPAPDTRVTGFKEIYWMPEQQPDRMPGFLTFLQQVFPGARFVFNSRDLDEVARSKWWARNPNGRAELETLEKQYVETLDGFGDSVYRVHYNDYVADPTVLRGLFEWLGEEFDEPRVRAVLEVRHSY
jgi:Sulfotransferase family